MSMSRDGLLPKAFSRIHPKFKTPSFATIITGLVVGIPSMCVNLTIVTDLTSIGTLFAFVVVCAGILIVNRDEKKVSQGFRVPYVNGKFIVMPLIFAGFILSMIYDRKFWSGLFHYSSGQTASKCIYFLQEIPVFIFLITTLVAGILSYLRNLSLIPVLGLVSCLFLMTRLGHTNWLIFSIWLLAGLVVYFTFSIRNSRLNRPGKTSDEQ
jgi:amino acid transporter